MLQLQLQLHYTTLFTLHRATTTTTRPYTRLHYSIPHNTTQHYAALHYNYTTPRLHYNCNCTCKYTNYTTLQLQLHYTTTTATATTATATALHHTTSSSCGKVTTATIATIPKKNNSDSNHLSVHQWIRSAIRDSQQPTSPIGFLFLKLPPPPCAVLLAL